MDFSEITLDVAGDINKAIAAILHEGISPDKKIELIADVLKQCQKKAGVYVDPTSDDFKRHHKCDCVFEVSGYNSRNGVLKNFKKG